jgi:hypothetical protein
VGGAFRSWRSTPSHFPKDLVSFFIDFSLLWVVEQNMNIDYRMSSSESLEEKIGTEPGNACPIFETGEDVFGTTRR